MTQPCCKSNFLPTYHFSDCVHFKFPQSCSDGSCIHRNRFWFCNNAPQDAQICHISFRIFDEDGFVKDNNESIEEIMPVLTWRMRFNRHNIRAFLEWIGYTEEVGEFWPSGRENDWRWGSQDVEHIFQKKHLVVVKKHYTFAVGINYCTIFNGKIHGWNHKTMQEASWMGEEKLFRIKDEKKMEIAQIPALPGVDERDKYMRASPVVGYIPPQLFLMTREQFLDLQERQERRTHLKFDSHAVKKALDLAWKILNFGSMKGMAAAKKKRVKRLGIKQR